jgi:hypothetical protein
MGEDDERNEQTHGKEDTHRGKRHSYRK